MVSKENVYARIKQSGNLPTLPEILLKLLEACDNEATPLNEIASIICKDPALSFRVLQLVNSSYYGLRRTFTGVEQAVVYLGSNSIKNIAITTSIHQVFERKRFKVVKQFNINSFWWHSLMCATFAKRLAQKTGFSSLDEAYLSGLLHDIGRLILISTFPEEHASILLETSDVRNELWAETQLIGVTHCEAGSWLVHNWKLNSLMADAILYHHEPLEKIREAFPLVKIVYISNLLSEEDNDFERGCEAGNLLLGLSRDDLLTIADGATEEVSQIAENLSINIKAPRDRKKSPVQEQAPIELDSHPGDSAGSPVAAAAGELDAKGQEALTARVKSISLLSGILENLLLAGDREEIIAVFEQSMTILFDIDKVLFFLPDRDGKLLKGYTSPSSSLHHLSRGLTLPVKQNSSLIVKTYTETAQSTLSKDGKQDSLADHQVLTTFRSDALLLVPIVADKQPAGVIVLGLPKSLKTLSYNDQKLVQIVSQQVGLCLHLEKMKAQKAEDLEAERLAAVSMTARKLAHEINNPLGIISNYLTSMSLKLPEDNDIQEELEIIGEEISRISSMVNQMDSFSQAAFTRFETIDVNAVIKDIIHIVRVSLFASAGLKITFQPDALLPEVKTSRDAIKQIMINLLKNSSEAMAEGGSVEVRTRRISAPPDTGRASKKGGIEIIVSDTGPGLPDSIRAKLFQPFFTTKKVGHSGLGLSIVDKTVKDLGGNIQCSSKVGEGTSFTISLPLEKI
jgi:signal transduction histidine kinase/HD-like signal output (HDOD) protein